MVDFTGIKIAVDFDGTIVEHEYPEIGKEKLFAFLTLKELEKKGAGLYCGLSVQEKSLMKQWNSAGKTVLSFMLSIRTILKRL